MKCSQCGTALPAGTRFCPGCGLPFVTPVPATAPAPKSSFSIGSVVAAVVLIVVPAIVTGVSGYNADSSPPTAIALPTIVPTSHKVTYKVTGSASTVDVTYENGTGGSQQENGVSVPWSQTFDANSGSFLYISAQNQGDSGDVHVEITVDGQPRKQANASGGYAIADTNDTL